MKKQFWGVRVNKLVENSGSLKEQVYNYLVNLILEGSLQPGDKIPELRIAKAFGISRTPVREAMRQLYSNGILEYRPNCNPTVAQWDNEKILQLEVVRTDMENLAARLAIIYGSNNDFEQMRLHSEACYKAGREGDIVSVLKEDAAFHYELARISKNEQLMKFMYEIHMQIQFLLCWRKDFLVPAEQQYEQHQAIIEALLKRDDKVVYLLTKHNRHSISKDLPQFPVDFFCNNITMQVV